MKYRISPHAEKEFVRRQIPHESVEAVLAHSEEIVPASGGRSAYQSMLLFEEGKMFLLRVIVDDSGDPPVVVTAYRTSKIAKYRRQP